MHRGWREIDGRVLGCSCGQLGTHADQQSSYFEQVLPQLLPCLVAFGRLLGETAQNQRIECGRDRVVLQVHRRGDRLVVDLRPQYLLWLSRERSVAGDELVGQTSHGVDVRTSVTGLVCRLFWRHVLCSAENLPLFHHGFFSESW